MICFIPTGSDPKVFILYCKDDQVVGRSAEEFCDDVGDLADLLSHTGGLKCYFDAYDQLTDPTDGTPTEQHPTNWSKWTEKMIEMSDFVLIVCSPSLHRHLQSHSQVEMTRGKFFANAITNVIDSHASKFIPVFLNVGCQQELVPTSLRMSTSYSLNMAEFRERLGDTEGLTHEQFASRLSEVLQELRFQNIVALLAHLRGEPYNPQPHPPPNPVRLPAQLQGPPAGKIVLQFLIGRLLLRASCFLLTHSRSQASRVFVLQFKFSLINQSGRKILTLFCFCVVGGLRMRLHCTHFQC